VNIASAPKEVPVGNIGCTIVRCNLEAHRLPMTFEFTGPIRTGLGILALVPTGARTVMTVCVLATTGNVDRFLSAIGPAAIPILIIAIIALFSALLHPTIATEGFDTVANTCIFHAAIAIITHFKAGFAFFQVGPDDAIPTTGFATVV